MGYTIKGERITHHKIRVIFALRTRSRRGLITGPLTHREHLPDLRTVELYSWDRDSLLDQAPLES
jgi:hypothetical protein